MIGTDESQSQNIQRSALLTKLSQFLELDEKERQRLAEFESVPQALPPHQVIVSENDRYERAAVLVEGWCEKYKLLEDGRRQVLNFLLPGSFIGLHANVFDLADHSISTLTPCQISWFDPQTITKTFAEFPRLAAAIVWDDAREQAFLMERLMSLGRRSAYESLAHLVVEVGHLLAKRGRPLKPHEPLPISQTIVADALGLSLVHVSRTIKRLRSEGLIEDSPQRGIAVRDLEGLIRVCGYDETYLHEHLMPAKTEKTIGGQ